MNTIFSDKTSLFSQLPASDVELCGQVCQIWLSIERHATLATEGVGDIVARINALRVTSENKDLIHRFRHARNQLTHTGSVELSLRELAEIGGRCISLVKTAYPQFPPFQSQQSPSVFGSYLISWLPLEVEVRKRTTNLGEDAGFKDRIQSLDRKVTRETKNLILTLASVRNSLLHSDQLLSPPEVFTCRVDGAIKQFLREYEFANVLPDRLESAWRQLPSVLMHAYFASLLRLLHAGESEYFKVPAYMRPQRWMRTLRPEEIFNLCSRVLPRQFGETFVPLSAERSVYVATPHHAGVDAFLNRLSALFTSLDRYSRAG